MGPSEHRLAQMGDSGKRSTTRSDWLCELNQGEFTINTASWYTVPREFGFHHRRVDLHLCNFIIDGSAVLEVMGQQHHLEPGSLWWIAPNVEISMSLDKHPNFTMLNTKFSVHHSGQCQIGFPERYIIQDNRFDVQPWLELILDDRLRRPHDACERARRMYWLLYSELGYHERIEEGTLSAKRRAQILGYVRKHIGLPIAPADLAHEVGLSEDYFRRIFTKTYHKSPRSWITDERMRAAGSLLIEQTAVSIAEIAHNIGYPDPASFSRQFKRSMGMTPMAWRRQ